MPGLPQLDFGDQALVPFSHHATRMTLQLGAVSPISRVFVSFAAGGNRLQVACLRPPESPGSDGSGGKVVEVRLGDGDDEGGVAETRRRRIAYGSMSAFALLQSRKNSFSALSRMPSAAFNMEWWQHVLEYSRAINSLLSSAKPLYSPVIEDSKTFSRGAEEPTTLSAAWELMEIFYVDKQLHGWLPERLVDWLADYDSLLSSADGTLHSKIFQFQGKLSNLQVIEDDSSYWEALSSALAVGWLDIVVNLLRLHGSYKYDQLDNRETENGLVEAVAVLVSTMPRMRPDLAVGKLGQCCKSKPDFVKAWEKWRGQISKLECCAFWIQCEHQKTRNGLRNLLQIMLGNSKSLIGATFHWLELFVSHFLYVKPFTVGLEGMQQLSQKCMHFKSSSGNNGLVRLLNAILAENLEVVLAECSRSFGSWMVAHAAELIAADNEYADVLLHEERDELGGMSIEELHRLTYAQVLSSHSLTWQVAPTYLSSCLRQGWGLLEILLQKQDVKDHHTLLKTLEICHLYELEDISANIMKIAGMYHWKHGRKGMGIYWFQQAHEKPCLDKIAEQLFESIGKSISDDSLKEWEGLSELLGSSVGSIGGLDFLHRYRDYKRLLHKVIAGGCVDSARPTMEVLIQLVNSPSTPKRFWLPLLHDSVKLINWKAHPLLSSAETNMLLSKLQDYSLAKACPGFGESHLQPHALNSVRLALAANLSRSILEEP